MKLSRFLILFGIFLNYATAKELVTVEALDEQRNNSCQLTLRLKISNNSLDTLTNIRAKYFLNYERNRKLVITPYYMAGANVSTDTLGDYLVINIDVSKIEPGVFPNSSGISIGLNYADFENFQKDENFSYPKTSTFVKTTLIPIYTSKTILAGSPPINNETPKIRFTGIQPENSSSRSAWVELENYGKTDIDLNNFYLKWSFRDSTTISAFVLHPGNRIRICQFDSPLECPATDINIVKGNLPFEQNGELVLSENGSPIDYIAWGKTGLMADSVRAVNERLETIKFFDTKNLDFAGPVVSYEIGAFYRAIISREDSTILRWNLFSASQINLDPSSMPSAEPLSLSDSSIVYLNSGEKTSFSWSPVEGAKSYYLIIVNAFDSSLAYEKITRHTSEDVELPFGEYLWGVASSTEEDMAGWSIFKLFTPGSQIIENIVKKISSSRSSPKTTWIHLLLKNSQSGIPIYNLSVTPQAARKDSYMLDLKWGQYILDYSWDSPRNSSSYVDENWNLQFSDYKEKFYNKEESWRCWIVATSILNHYYGGNITQDEIKFFKFGKKKPILGAFPQGEDGGGYESDIDDALRWALNISKSKLHKSNERPSESSIIHSLSIGRPVIIWQKQHIMIIDALMKDSETEKFAFRFLNTDNNGKSQWKVYQNESQIKRAWFPELTQSPKMSELYIDTNGDDKMTKGVDFLFDSDEDGLLDFDEENRFLSKKNNPDSDGDGIEDKVEIMSYTLYEPYHEGGVSKETVVDIDGDGKRAEMDEDSDNGGRTDGLEDSNRNGKKDIGETNPYIAFDDFNSSNPAMPKGFALYAISNLRINDGVKCFDENTYCNIGAAAINSTETFPSIIGARASVGNVYSRGNLFFRSHSRIYGNVYLANNASIDKISMQNGSAINGKIIPFSDSEWFSSFPTIYPLRNYSLIGKQSISVPAKSTIDLYDGIQYENLKIAYGGTIRIHPGEIWIGNLDIEPGAKIEFVAPGYQTILHINGSFIWRGKIQNKEFSSTNIAKGFKLVQHSPQKMYVDETFLGSIIAPTSHVILGQSHKVFYGAVMAKDLSVHQYTVINYIPFEPVTIQYAFEF